MAHGGQSDVIARGRVPDVLVFAALQRAESLRGFEGDLEYLLAWHCNAGGWDAARTAGLETGATTEYGLALPVVMGCRTGGSCCTVRRRGRRGGNGRRGWICRRARGLATR